MTFSQKKEELELELSSFSDAISNEVFLSSAERLAIVELLIEKGIITWEEFNKTRLRKMSELEQGQAEAEAKDRRLAAGESDD